MLLVAKRFALHVVSLDNENDVQRLIDEEIRQALTESAEIELD